MVRRTTPTRPAIYARISKDSAGKGLGVARQIKECRELAARLGWPEPEVYRDNDIPATKPRPGFERLMADIEAGRIDGLMAWHLDRLLRRVLDLERIVKTVENCKQTVPIAFKTAAEVDLMTASGRMTARILASVAQNEIEQKAERIAAQRRQEAMSGKPPSVLGYGYNSNGSVNSDEAAIIREVAERLLSGASIHGVATDLNRRGIPTPAAGRWDARRVAAAVKRNKRPELVTLIEAARDHHRTTVDKVAALIDSAGGVLDSALLESTAWGQAWVGDEVGLTDSDIAEMLKATQVEPDPTAWRSSALVAMVTRAALCGWREYSPGQQGRGEFVAQGDWPAILPKDTVEELRARFRQRPSQTGRKPKYLLSGILTCGECGLPMMGGPTRSGNHRYGCLHQPGKPHCGKVSIAGSQVDAMITETILDVLSDADVRAGLKRVGPTDDSIREAEEELAEVARTRAEYAKDAAAGIIRRDEWMILKDGLAARERAAAAVLGTWSPRVRDALSDVPAERGAIEHWWGEVATLERKREVIRSFIENVPVASTTARPGSNRFDGSRVGEPVWLV